MNFFETQDFFKTINPGKNLSFDFDHKCHRIHELIYTDGKPNPIHHVENNKVKVTVEGQDPIYVPIKPHRQVYTWEAIKNMINLMDAS